MTRLELFACGLFLVLCVSGLHDLLARVPTPRPAPALTETRARWKREMQAALLRSRLSQPTRFLDNDRAVMGDPPVYAPSDITRTGTRQWTNP